MLREGRFVEVAPRLAVERAHTVRLWLKSGSCLEFTILLDPADDQSASVRTGLDDVSVPPLPDKCRSQALQVKPGMTRADVETRLTPDVSLISYEMQTVTVLAVLSHKEYDKGGWKRACNC